MDSVLGGTLSVTEEEDRFRPILGVRMALVLCYTADKFDNYLCFCVKFLNRRFGSLFLLPRVPIS